MSLILFNPLEPIIVSDKLTRYNIENAGATDHNKLIKTELASVKLTPNEIDVLKKEDSTLLVCTWEKGERIIKEITFEIYEPLNLEI